MHGLVNRAIQCFVQDTYGLAAWRAICATAGAEETNFEAMLIYEASLTESLLAAGERALARPREVLLEDIGTYLISHPELTSPRRLMRFSGAGFLDFLHSLDELPDRIRLAIPDLSFPAIELADEPDGGYSLTCGAWFDGFGYVLAGVLRAMADEYGALVTIEVSPREADGRETLHIEVHHEAFAPGRAESLSLAG